MLIKTLKLNDYRNYSNYCIELDPKLNIIVGKNGIGKTNILESIIVVSNTKSFRTTNDQDLINKEKDYLKIELETEKDKFKVVVNKKNKSLYINDKLIKKTSQYLGKINAILFKPSDLQIFTDSPSDRRKILDVEIGKINNKYLLSLQKYNHLLKDKNKLLKEIEIDENLLKSINEAMLPQIKTIIIERQNIINSINNNISKYYRLISGNDSNIKIIYKPCSDIEEIEDKLSKSIEKDYIYHYATYGPQKDDYYFEIDSYDLNSIASQGQKRMTLIAFKFALIKYIEENTNVTPIVLLDDIMSELDKDNQERLLNNLPNNTQVIITNTEIENINIDKEYKLIELKEEDNV